MTIKLGQKVKAKELKDGVPLKAQWFDEQRLTATSKAKAGGPQDHPPELHP